MTPKSHAAWLPSNIHLISPGSHIPCLPALVPSPVSRLPSLPRSLSLASRRPASVSTERKLTEPRPQIVGLSHHDSQDRVLGVARRGSIPGLSPAAKALRPTTNPARFRIFVAFQLAKLSSMSSGDKLVATSRMPTWDVSLVDIVPCAIHWLLSPRFPRMITFVVVNSLPGWFVLPHHE